MRAGAGPPRAGPGVMPTPAAGAAPREEGALARPGRTQAYPRARGRGPSSRAPPRTGGRALRGTSGFGRPGRGWGSADPLRARAGSCPAPTAPRVCSLHQGTIAAPAPWPSGARGRRARRERVAERPRAPAAHKGTPGWTRNPVPGANPEAGACGRGRGSANRGARGCC